MFGGTLWDVQGQASSCKLIATSMFGGILRDVQGQASSCKLIATSMFGRAKITELFLRRFRRIFKMQNAGGNCSHSLLTIFPKQSYGHHSPAVLTHHSPLTTHY